MTDLKNHLIRKRAHEMWVNDGRPENRALDYWLAAESELRETERTSRLGDQGRASPQSGKDAKKARPLDWPKVD